MERQKTSNVQQNCLGARKKVKWSVVCLVAISGVPRGGGFGGFKPPPEILKAPQNRAKLNPIVKTVKNC